MEETKTGIALFGPSCPCGKKSAMDTQRVHRGFLVKLFLGWLPLQKYHCYGCMRTRYMLVKKGPAVTHM